MAKRGRKAGGGLEKAAIDLGTFFGNVARHVDSWVGERDRLAQQLRHIQSTAGDLLTKLSSAGRRARTVGTRRAAQGSGKKTRRFSAATRAKMRASQKARWAKVKARKGGAKSA